MLDLGYVLPGSTLNIPFATYDSNDPSASVTATGLAATDIEIYRDGGLTQRASDAGYAVDADFDTITGLHTIQIDLSDNTTVGFFRAGSEYLVALSSITVDAATINAWLARFTIGIPGMVHGSTIAVYTSTDNFTLNTGSTDNDAYNGCILIAYDVATQYQTQIGVIEDYTGATRTVNLLADPGIFTMTANDNIIIMPPALLPTVAGRTLDVTATGAAGIDWGNVENPTTVVDLSGTDIQLCDTTTDVTNGVSLAAGAITNASLAGNMEIVFETDFATNYNATRNAWATNVQDFVGTTAADPFNAQVVAASVSGAVGSVTAGVTLAAGAITNASLAGNMEIVFETDFATNYNTTRNAWATNVQDTVGSGNLPANTVQIEGVDATDQINAACDTALTDYDAVVPADLPTNFADLSISVTTGRVDVGSWLGNAVTFGTGGPDVNINAISDDTQAAINLEAHCEAVITGTTSGTPTTTTTDTDLTGFADDELIGRVIIFKSGTANGQAAEITDYASTNGVVTFSAITTAPASGDTFVIE